MVRTIQVGLLLLVLAACGGGARTALGHRPFGDQATAGGATGGSTSITGGTGGTGALGGTGGMGALGGTGGVPPTPRLHTSGRNFLDPNGNVVVLRGVAIADPHDLDQRGESMTAYDLLGLLADASQGYYARVVRITVYPDIWLADPEGYLVQDLEPTVQRATELGLYAIIDWHEISDVQPVADRVALFWKRVAPVFADYPNVLYEIFNEPMDIGNPSWQNWKQAAQPWVDEIRAVAPETVILIGGPFWDQQIAGAASDPFVGDNLAYVGHIYPISAPQMLDPSSPIATAAETRPVMITEWGFRQGSIDVAEGTRTSFGEPLRAFVDSRGLSWTAWCADDQWEPAMFDSNWHLRIGEGEMGGFVREWLASEKDSNQPR